MSSFKEKFSQFFERKADKAVERINHTPTNKLILIVLVLFSVGSVAIGALQVKAFLDKPFFSDKLVEDKGKIRGPLDLLDYIREQQQTNAAITKMQQRDTDGDGLNDYDEVYVYHTNPYTKFTNGGDKSDKELVDSGEWRNGCIGANCNSNTDATPTTVTNTNGIVPDINAVTPTDNSNAVATNSASAGNTAVGSTAVGNVNTLNTNISTNTNSAVSTDLSSQLLASGGISQLTAVQKAELRNYFQKISTSDLRLMLASQGFEQAKIDAMTDADLTQTLNGLLEGLK